MTQNKYRVVITALTRTIVKGLHLVAYNSLQAFPSGENDGAAKFHRIAFVDHSYKSLITVKPDETNAWQQFERLVSRILVETVATINVHICFFVTS